MASHRAAGRQSYVYGTAARDMAAERERTRERRVVQYRQNMSHTVRRNQEKALQMNLPYVIMLTLAAVCALYICIGYLHVQSSMTAKIHNIETLEQQLEQLRSENDADPHQYRYGPGSHLQGSYRGTWHGICQP